MHGSRITVPRPQPPPYHSILPLPPGPLVPAAPLQSDIHALRRAEPQRRRDHAVRDKRRVGHAARCVLRYRPYPPTHTLRSRPLLTHHTLRPQTRISSSGARPRFSSTASSRPLPPPLRRRRRRVPPAPDYTAARHSRRAEQRPCTRTLMRRWWPIPRRPTPRPRRCAHYVRTG